jgi:hypothetical protein
MMAIPDKNETIYQVVYTSLTEIPSVKALKEFGFYNYFIYPSETRDCKYNI